MTDRPILFSAPMVKALLAGTKTQTRRVMNPQPELLMNGLYHVHDRYGGLVNVKEEDVGREALDFVRFAVGDRLYVREAWRTWAQYDVYPPSGLTAGTHIAYEAGEGPNLGSNPGKFRQGMHMPRWASRLTLLVTDVRVQRLQDISEADAIAEGVVRPLPICEDDDISHVAAYEALWDHLNAARGFGWATNPWVVAVSFEIAKMNIDRMAA